MANPEKPEGNENTKKPKKPEKHKKKGGRKDTYKNFESMNWKTLYQQHDKMCAIINLLCTYHHTEHDMSRNEVNKASNTQKSLNLSNVYFDHKLTSSTGTQTDMRILFIRVQLLNQNTWSSMWIVFSFS
jgi:hypothetical protein